MHYKSMQHSTALHHAMPYKIMQKSGLTASVIGLGGEWFNNRSQEEISAIFDLAFAEGVNYLDVFMPQPDTRGHIGHALKGRREGMIIQGHLCTVFEGGQYERSRDLAKVQASFEDLLARLQTDYIDVGMIHYVDSMEDLDLVCTGGILDYARALHQKGVIRHVGISSHNPLVALRAVETGYFDVLMFSINAAYDLEKAETDIFELMDFKGLESDGWAIDPARQALYAACERAGVGITVMKALGAGSLLKAETSPFGQAMTVTQCCHYCLTRPGVCSVLVGCANVDELRTALEYRTASPEERSYAPILSTSGKVRITGKCMYCNHCQPCPMHIDVAAVTKYLDLATLHDSVPETVRRHYFSLEKTADGCILCGQCEPNCPFEVEIRENMQRAQMVFAKS